MKAVTYKGPNDVTVADVPDAKIEHPADVLVRITSTNICGSDLHMYEGRTSFEPGRTFGHENLGEVIETGPAASKVKVGDRVVLPFNIACGFCKNCDQGFTNYCLTMQPESKLAGAAYGFADMGPYSGGQAEYLRVPYGDFNCLRLGEDAVEKELDYVMVADIFPTGWHATEMAGVYPGDSVVIYGAGPVGLMAAYSAIIKGAGKVMVVDRQKDRMKLAEQIGAIPVDDSATDPVEFVKDQTMGFGADCGCECVGYQAHDTDGNEHPNLTLNRLVDSVRFVGGLGVVGVFLPQDPGGPDELAKQGQIAFDYGNYWFKGQKMDRASVRSKNTTRPCATSSPAIKRAPPSSSATNCPLIGLPKATQTSTSAKTAGPKSSSIRSGPESTGQDKSNAETNMSLEKEAMMRAMVYRGPYKIRVEEKDIPPIEHPNDAIVRVTRAAICGSDLHLYHGMMPDTRVGMTFGHEFIGVVEQVGSSVKNLKPGDRVMVPFNIFCGTCYFCARGLYSNCHNVNPNATAVGGIYGYSHTCGGYDGGQSEYVRVPFADVGPGLIPDWLEDEDAVLLTDALPTGYFGAQLGSIAEGDTVVVFGAGPVGLFAAKSSWLMGAGRVIVIDHLEYRLEKARTFAHAETYNFAEYDDIVVEMKKTTDYLGADVVIDAVGAEADGSFLQHVTSAKFKLQAGSPVALNWAIDSVRKGGTVSVVGAYGPLFSAVKLGDAMNKGLTLRMNQCPVKRQWPRLLEHIRNGYLKPSDIVTHRIPLEHIAEGYHIFSAKLDNCIKPLVIPNAN